MAAASQVNPRRPGPGAPLPPPYVLSSSVGGRHRLLPTRPLSIRGAPHALAAPANVAGRGAPLRTPDRSPPRAHQRPRRGRPHQPAEPPTHRAPQPSPADSRPPSAAKLPPPGADRTGPSHGPLHGPAVRLAAAPEPPNAAAHPSATVAHPGPYRLANALLFALPAPPPSPAPQPARALPSPPPTLASVLAFCVGSRYCSHTAPRGYRPRSGNLHV